MLQRLLLVWLVLSSAVAVMWPYMALDGWFDPFLASKPYLSWLVATTMFCVGTLLPSDELREIARRWPTILSGTTVQYVSMPFLAWTIATAMNLPDDYRVGVIFVGCVPGAMASNVLTIIARGNVCYSVGLTTSATLLSPLVVPVAIKLTLQADADRSLLLNSALQLCWQVVLPVVCGFSLCRVSSSVRAAAGRLSEPIANLAILWIIAVVVGMNRERMFQLSPTLVAALVMLNLLGYCAGELGGRLLRLTPAMRRALVIEVGMQNAGLGASLATILFADRPGVALPSGMYAFGCMLTGTVLAKWYRHLEDARSSASPPCKSPTAV